MGSQHPKKVLHITFDMGIGGTEQVIRQLINNLDSSAFQCEIACIDGKIGPVGTQLAEQGIPLHSHTRQAGLDWGLIRWLRHLIKSRNIDIVHAHQYSPYSYAWFAHWGLGVKLIFTEHGRFHPDRHRTKARFINPLIAHTTDHIVAISSATKDALAEYEYLPKNKIRVIYNGIAGLRPNQQQIDTLRDSLGIHRNDRVIGTVARLDPVKNHPLMIKATQTLIEQGHPVKLLIVGDGPERESLEKLTEQLHLKDAVLFTGFQNQPAEYLALLDIFLLPSFTEGTSITLLEAMSLGIPAVATRVGGTPEIVEDEETGILIESDNLPGFVNSVSRLLVDPHVYSSMAEATLQRFQTRYSVEQMVSHYQTLYLK